MRSNVFLAYCNECDRVHAFPRDMAERPKEQTFRHLIPDLFVILLVIGSVPLWMWGVA